MILRTVIPAIKCCLGFYFLFISLGSFADEKLAVAESFWKEFRMAVISNNNEEIAALTQFPFKVRRVDDSQPQQLVKHNNFSGILQQLLNQQIFIHQGGKFESRSMRQLIEDNPNFAQKNFLTPNLFRFYQFEFEEINGSWYLVLAYLEE